MPSPTSNTKPEKKPIKKKITPKFIEQDDIELRISIALAGGEYEAEPEVNF